VTSVSQCESETGVCNRLEKDNFNENFNVQCDILNTQTLEVAVMNAV